MSAELARATGPGAGVERESHRSSAPSAVPADPLRDLLARACAMLSADMAGIWLPDEGDRLRLLAIHGLPVEARPALASLAVNEARPWARVLTGDSLVRARARCHPGASRLATALAAVDLETIVSAPVRAAVPGPDGVAAGGMLLLGFAGARVIGDQVRDSLTLLADLAGTLVANTRLAASVDRLEARLRAIEDLALRLNRIQDVRGIGEAIVAEVGQLTSFDTVRVYLVDEASGMCEPLAFRGHFMGVANPSPDMLRVPIGAGLTGWVAVHGESLYVPNSLEDPRSRFVGPDLGPESLLVVPMAYEGRVRGVIVLSQRGRDRFTPDDQVTLSVFAGHAAQAVTNAESYARVAAQQAELQLQLASQRRLLEVSEHLLATFDSRVVLELIADSLAAVVAHDSLTIYRVDRETGMRRAVVARDPYAEQILADESYGDSGLTGWVISHREALLVNDAHLDPRTRNIPGTPVEAESVIVVPLISDGAVLGTLNLSRFGSHGYFSQAEFELTKLFAGQASMALRTAEAHEAAQSRAARDALTGLRHHGSFELDLRAMVEAGRPLALLMLDLDGFKAYNDTCGHQAGDGLLRNAAAAMLAAVRADDHVYRYGGDEFAVILDGTSREAAEEAAGRIAAAIAALSSDGRPRVSISIGLAAFPESGSTVKALVTAADESLYKQKRVRDRWALEAELAALAGGGVPEGAKARRSGVQVRLAAAIEQASDAILITDTEGRIQYVNPAFERTTGYSRAEVLGQNPRILRSGTQSAAFYRSLWATVTDGRAWRGELRNRRRDGSLVTVEATITPLRDERGEIAGFVGAQRDMTRERASEAFALRAARERALVVDMVKHLPAGQPVERTAEAICTQVASLEGVESAALYAFATDGRALPLAISPAPAEGALRPLSLRQGRHLLDRAAEAGPWVEAADRRPGVRDGEPSAWSQGAQAFIPVTWNGEPTAVLVAASIAADAVLHLTEHLAVLAEMGVITAALIAPALAGQAPLARKRSAIEAVIAARAFHPVFQPVLDLRSGDVVGYEVLTRFDDGVPPDIRFAEAKEAGVGLELEQATLETALGVARRLPEGRWLSINVSPALVLAGRPLPDLVGGQSRRLVIEVTESEPIEDYPMFRNAVAAVAPDVLLAVDDAGAGFASLRHILELWPDFVKLDRSLVSGIDRDPARQALVAGMQHFATATDCVLIAEGIETAGEAETLVTLGVPFGQGFYLGRPAGI